MLLGAVDIRLTESTTGDRSLDGNLYRLGWVEIDDVQDVGRTNTVEVSENLFGHHFVIPKEVVAVEVLEDNIESELVRTGVLAADHTGEVTEIVFFHNQKNVSLWSKLDGTILDGEERSGVLYFHEMVDVKLKHLTHVCIRGAEGESEITGSGHPALIAVVQECGAGK